MNLRPSGYEPDELPDCSTPRQCFKSIKLKNYSQVNFRNTFFICLLMIFSQKPIISLAQETTNKNTKLTKNYSSSDRSQKAFSSVQLVSPLQSLSTSTEKIAVGIWIELDPNWHTYWKFPGTTGKALNIHWNTNEQIKMRAAPLRWPIPERFRLGSSINFIYKNQVLLTTELSLNSPLLKLSLLCISLLRWNGLFVKNCASP